MRLSKLASLSNMRPFSVAVSAETQKYVDKDRKYVGKYCNTPDNLVIEKGERIYLYDIQGNKYFDMLAGFAGVSQGHCHPKIVEAMHEQSKILTNCSRSLLNKVLPDTAEYLCDYLGYD